MVQKANVLFISRSLYHFDKCHKISLAFMRPFLKSFALMEKLALLAFGDFMNI